MPLNCLGSLHWPRVPQFGQGISARPSFGGAALAGLELLLEVIGPEPAMAVQALGQRIAERGDVPGRLPHLRAPG